MRRDLSGFLIRESMVILLLLGIDIVLFYARVWGLMPFTTPLAYFPFPSPGTTV